MKLSLPLGCIALFALLSGSCKKEEAIVPLARKSSGELNKPFYFMGDVEGVPAQLSMQWKQTDVMFSFTDHSVFSGDDRCIAPGTKIVAEQGFFDSPSITFKNYCYNETEQGGDAFFKNLFSPRSHAFYQYYNVDSMENYQSNGVIISIVDSSGVEWSTKWGPQEGSVFNVLESLEAPAEQGNMRINVLAEFKCRLYDNEGNKKTLENGSFYFPYEKVYD